MFLKMDRKNVSAFLNLIIHCKLYPNILIFDKGLTRDGNQPNVLNKLHFLKVFTI